MIKKVLFIILLFSATLAFSQEKSLTKLTAVPNPFVTQTKINFVSDSDQTIIFSVKNVLGRTVHKKKMKIKKGKNSIPFSKDNHQNENAKILRNIECAIIVKKNEINNFEIMLFIDKLVNDVVESNAAIGLISANVQNPFGYGRIVKNNEEFEKIIEESDASETEKLINEINSGIYCIDINFLTSNIGSLESSNNQKEFYLTDYIYF